MKIAELVREIEDLDPASIPAVLAACAARLATTHEHDEVDDLLTVEQAAANSGAPNDSMLSTAEAAVMLHRSVKWLYRRRNALPFARKLGNRSYVFSRNGLEKWLARQRG
jgi:hypothetical protein